MKKEFWLLNVERNKDILRRLIEQYHPVNLKSHTPTDTMAANITAPEAERAAEIGRNQIRKETVFPPEIMFDNALSKKDHTTLAEILGATWVGVPESTDCWRIEGFNVLVDLLDDPVEEEE